MAVLEATQLWKEYGAAGRSRVSALRGVDVRVEGGEFLTIMGPSGCGKSTLLHVLGGIDPPSSGQVLFEGRDLGSLNDAQRSIVRRRRIGFVFQRMNLLPTLSALENVALPLRIDGASQRSARDLALAALERVHLSQRTAQFPHELSGGEQQRVGIARALVIRPAVVLADEPTGALDSANGQSILQLLRECANQGQTVVMVTHDAVLARQADRLVLMRDGQIVSTEAQDRPALDSAATSRLERFGDAMSFNRFGGSMNLVHVIFRQWRQRPARTMLSIFSVAIAVAAVLGIALAQSSVRLGYRKLLAVVEGRPALEIVATDGERFAIADIPRLDDVAGVHAAFEFVTRATLARVQGKRFRSVLLGVRDDDPRIWDALPIVEGRSCHKADEALVSAELAHNLQIGVGDRLVVLARRGPRSAKIVGLVNSAALREFSPAASLVMPLAGVQSSFDLGQRVDRVRVLVDQGQREGAKATIASRLPAALLVQAPVEQTELADTIVRSTELALRFAGALTMAMAAFIILNTLRMNFGERRRDSAVMRVLGMTTGQLARLHLLEGAALGLVGSLLGIPLGLALGHVLGEVTRQLISPDIDIPPLPLWTLPLALVAGPLVACIAALLPAIQVRDVSPNEALGDPEKRRGERFPLATVVIGGVLWTIATTILLLVSFDQLSAEAAIPAGLFMLLGYIAITPALAGPIVRATARAIFPGVRMESQFAAEQLLERRTRTGLTVGVLIVAVSTGIGMGNSIINNVRDVRTWFRRMSAGDIMLAGPSMIERQADVRDKPDVRAMIAEQPGVDYVVETRFLSTRVNGLPAMCVVQEFDPRMELPWSVSPSDEERLRAGLGAGEAVVGNVLAQKLALHLGDMLRVELQGRTISLRIAGLVRDYTSGGLSLFLDQHAAAKLVELGPAEIYTVTATVGTAIDPLVDQLKQLVSREGLVVQSYVDLRNQLGALIDGVVGALWALIAVGFVIGGVAVANTLTMSVLEQTRELGLLRIIGMTRAQVSTLVVCESLLLGVLGTLLGTLAGVTTAWVIHLCSEPLLGQSVPFVLHPWLLVLNALGCLAIAVLAAWSPARRAARLDLLEAIAYE